MNPLRRSIVAAIGLSPLVSFAQPARWSELNPPQPVDAQGKNIKVLEFFNYDCIHCYNFEPIVEAWEKKLPKDVEFERVAAPFNELWKRYSAAFYAFQTLGVLPKVHRAFFDLRHRDQMRLSSDKPVESEPWLVEWLQKQGIAPKKFFEVMSSFGVQTRVRRALQLTLGYKIEGTPQMGVHGRYTVAADQVSSREAMLETVDVLVERIRKGK